jgi:hypothetical protein
LVVGDGQKFVGLRTFKVSYLRNEAAVVMSNEQQTESQKFDAVMRKILTVSKEELKKREKVWKQKRERAKKKRATS